MKHPRLFIVYVAIAFLATVVVSCSNDDEFNFLQNRIVGEWKLTQEAGEDVSTRNWLYTFKSNGTILLPLRYQTVMPMELEASYEVVGSKITHNKETDEIEGVIRIRSYIDGSKNWDAEYNCAISNKTMTWTYKSRRVDGLWIPFGYGTYIFER